MNRIVVQFETNFWQTHHWSEKSNFDPNEEIRNQPQWIIQRYYSKKPGMKLPLRIHAQPRTDSKFTIVLDNIDAHLPSIELSWNINLGFWHGSFSCERDVRFKYFIVVVDVEIFTHEQAQKLTRITSLILPVAILTAEYMLSSSLISAARDITVL
jgi:hypothetical protein